MYTPTFDYYRPKSVSEAVDLLKQNQNAKLLAGGHSLLPAMKLRVSAPPVLIDLSRVQGLVGIQADASALKIGALTTHNAVATSPEVQAKCGLLAETAQHIGDQQVRNRGTLGGSLAHADPAADYPTAILALNATITATGPKGNRDIAAADFFKGFFTTALNPEEIITLVTVPTYGKDTGGAYMKHRHPASSYAVVGAAALVTLAGGKVSMCAIAVGGVMANPVRASTAEKALTGQTATDEHIAAAAGKVADAISEPFGDLYASGEYRTHLATVLVKRALLKAVERAKG